MTTGNTNVAPNIETTCCAPIPRVRGQLSRSMGPTTSPGRMFLPSPCTVHSPRALRATAAPVLAPGRTHANRRHSTAWLPWRHEFPPRHLRAPDARPVPRPAPRPPGADARTRRPEHPSAPVGVHGLGPVRGPAGVGGPAAVRELADGRVRGAVGGRGRGGAGLAGAPGGGGHGPRR